MLRVFIRGFPNHFPERCWYAVLTVLSENVHLPTLNVKNLKISIQHIRCEVLLFYFEYTSLLVSFRMFDKNFIFLPLWTVCSFGGGICLCVKQTCRITWVYILLTLKMDHTCKHSFHFSQLKMKKLSLLFEKN